MIILMPSTQTFWSFILIPIVIISLVSIIYFINDMSDGERTEIGNYAGAIITGLIIGVIGGGIVGLLLFVLIMQAFKH